MATQMGLKSAAQSVGLTEGLLILWISTGKFKPTVATSLKSGGSNTQEDRALAAYAGLDTEAFGWTRYSLTDSDVERLRALAEETATRRSRAEHKHMKGGAYTVAHLADRWGLGVDKVRELFKDEPGVIRISKPAKKGRRTYVNLRIPEAVATRVERRLS